MPASFFTRTTATNLWKGVTGVSNASRKRGRGAGLGRAVAKDFNRGQVIGEGRTKIVLPGLNTRVASGPTLIEIQDVGPDEHFNENLKKVREQMNVFRKYREAPMERGWSGRKAHGRHAGPPADYNETQFENFDSTVLMLRPVQSMSGLFGRVKRMHGMVVTGNGNGLAGFSVEMGNDGKGVIRKARNRAGQALVSIPRWDNHTVMHDFFSRYYQTTVFVERKPKGYGIRAHRIIKAICEHVGIKDLYARVEGSTHNQINLTKAFFLGLMNQRKYQDMANEKELHLVELRDENFGFPLILASPETKIRTDAEIKTANENLDFTYYIYDGKIKTVRPKPRSPFEDHPGWPRHLDKLDYGKNREKSKLLLAAKYGDTKVRDIFPYFKTNAESFNKPKEDQ